MNDAIRMQLSAYVDGELPHNEAEMLLRRVSQDVELRQEVAEFLALGRVMRGEAGVAGVDRLHDRVLAAIDNRPGGDSVAEDDASAPSAIKPLVRVVVVASVALAAIFGLQQTTPVADVVSTEPVATIVEVVPGFSRQQDQLRQYFLSHEETSSQMGANGLYLRLVTLRFSDPPREQNESDTESDIVDETVTRP